MRSISIRTTIAVDDMASAPPMAMAGCQPNPANRDAIAREVRTVAEEIASDPRYAGDDQLGPDDDARARFREFARKLSP